MVRINSIDISPPLINSSCAWSSDLEQLQALYASPYTGAVFTRTATINGFKEDNSHTVAFANSTSSSINSYGYSPYPLGAYLSWIETILMSQAHTQSAKPFVISITSSDTIDLRSMVFAIRSLRDKLGNAGISSPESRIAIELNTSCPNISNAPPAGYTFPFLVPLLTVLAEEYTKDPTLTIGLKLPPLVYRAQFTSVLDTIKTLMVGSADRSGPRCPFAFFTSTNTLGNSLLFSDQTDTPASAAGFTLGDFAVPTAVGGLAGEPLHPLALGNVYTFRQLLRERAGEGFGRIMIIGVGGVTSKEAVGRMRRAGASVVGCATLLGREGMRAFEILGS